MGKLTDLTGQRFGRLTVIKKVMIPGKRDVHWECKCDCGNTTYVTATHLRNGTVSCGCLRNEKIKKQKGGCHTTDITGQRFGNLVAIRPTKQRQSASVIWECKCDCGKIKNINVSALVTEKTISCGCHKNKLASERANEKFAKFKKENFVENTSIEAISKRVVYKNNKTGVRGVSCRKKPQKYIAQIKFQGKSYWLGQFDALEDATMARKEAESKLYDNFLEWYNSRDKDNGGDNNAKKDDK